MYNVFPLAARLRNQSMKTEGGSETAKRNAGERAAEEVTDGSVVGLGTGSTAAYAIEAIGRAVDDGLDVRGIPTSFQSRQLALEVGIPLTSLDAVDGVDLAIDGADQVRDDPSPNAETDANATAANSNGGGTLIKGGGGAHAREKLVAAAADRYLVVADPSKLIPELDRSVPVEILPAAHTTVAERVRELGGEPTLRDAEHKDGPVVTDNGNLVLDVAFGPIDSPAELATTLASIPGVVEHGLFIGLADATYVGTDDGVEKRTY
ncbi:ribose-5-phosphate isomerase A [Natrialba taiwanensis DSM 12281]|uniref:Ribose-5-phosphate isomerase A n=2 Tax=Natrialba taiwanensis TaxID=160846 RepID=L9ZS99_9EURY|nr:ribose-5-phosphate isomerase A [Natrialba taiwanensis DSM 12281]